MKKSVIVLIHGGYWLLYLLLLLVVSAVIDLQLRKGAAGLSLNFRPLFPIIVLAVAPNLLAFYSCYFLLFPKFLARKKIFLLMIFGAAACLLSAFLAVFASSAFFGFGQAAFTDPNELAPLLATLFILAAFHGTAALVMRGFITWYGEIRLKEELARKNVEMESALVRSQLDPHFLFNTLNNIDVLILKDAALASEYLNKLAGILRYLIYETKPDKIPLAAELGYMQKYIALQKIRTANSNYVDFAITGDTDKLRVAPMIFFPFLENAFKHTEGGKSTARIEVKICAGNGKVVFECANSHRSGGGGNGTGGVGSRLVQRRLELLYPDRHELAITDEDGFYRVKLTIHED